MYRLSDRDMYGAIFQAHLYREFRCWARELHSMVIVAVGHRDSPHTANSTVSWSRVYRGLRAVTPKMFAAGSGYNEHVVAPSINGTREWIRSNQAVLYTHPDTPNRLGHITTLGGFASRLYRRLADIVDIADDGSAASPEECAVLQHFHSFSYLNRLAYAKRRLELIGEEQQGAQLPQHPPIPVFRHASPTHDVYKTLRQCGLPHEDQDIG
jgi:hypothetical protein